MSKKQMIFICGSDKFGDFAAGLSEQFNLEVTSFPTAYEAVEHLDKRSEGQLQDIESVLVQDFVGIMSVEHVIEESEIFQDLRGLGAGKKTGQNVAGFLKEPRAPRCITSRINFGSTCPGIMGALLRPACLCLKIRALWVKFFWHG